MESLKKVWRVFPLKWNTVPVKGLINLLRLQAGRQTNGISVQYFFGEIDMVHDLIVSEVAFPSLPPPTKHCPLQSGLQCFAISLFYQQRNPIYEHFLHLKMTPQWWWGWFLSGYVSLPKNGHHGAAGEERVEGHMDMTLWISPSHSTGFLNSWLFISVKSSHREERRCSSKQIRSKMYLLEWSDRDIEKLISYSYQFSHISRSTSTTIAAAFCPTRKFSCKNIFGLHNSISLFPEKKIPSQHF